MRLFSIKVLVNDTPKVVIGARITVKGVRYEELSLVLETAITISLGVDPP